MPDQPESTGRIRKPVIVTDGDSVVIDPKTGEVIERNGEKVKPPRKSEPAPPKEDPGNA
jgi:hypothetical protein